MINGVSVNFKYLLLILLIPLGTVYATEYDIYVTGSDDSPGCQNDDSCWSNSSVLINQYDTITWHNDAHYSVSVTSGSILDDEVGDF